MGNYLSQVNATSFYVIVAAVLTFITIMCGYIVVKCYRAGIKMGMDPATLKKTITSSATFTLLPSISILLGVIALSGTLGVPLSWLRLSVIGSLQYELNVAEIAAQLGVSSEEVTEAVCAAQNTVSLTYDGDDGVRETDLPTVSTEDEISDRLVLEEAFTKLNEKERMIMECRYYRYMTQSNTAKVLNMTQVQVSRRERALLLSLREKLTV